MHPGFWISCFILRSLATGITLLNEVVLVAAPWIISGPTDLHASIPLPHQAITALVYACLEPFYASLLAYLGIQPWIHLLNSVHHLWICLCVVEVFKYLARMQRQEETDTIKRTSFKDKAKSDTEHRPGACEQRDLWRPDWQAFFATIVPLHSVAASNAALILFAANLRNCLQDEPSAIDLGLHSFGVICYLLSRFGDFLVARATSKPTIWPQRSDDSLRSYLACMGIILTVKTSLRWILGQSIFPVLSVMLSKEIRPLLAKQEPTWLKTAMEWKAPWPWPWWANVAMTWGGTLGQVYGFHLLRRAFAERRH